MVVIYWRYINVQLYVCCVSGATHTEALSWLETHGITMISPGDDASLVASTLEGGQTLVLTGTQPT